MKILVAVDNSKFSEAAVQLVIQQMRPEHTEVCVFNAVDLALVAPLTYAEALRTESLREADELVQKTGQQLEKAGYKVQTAVEEGDPRSKIIDYAKHWNADLILLGSHGRKGLDRFLIGSVAESVARHARCSVLIVRHP